MCIIKSIIRKITVKRIIVIFVALSYCITITPAALVRTLPRAGVLTVLAQSLRNSVATAPRRTHVTVIMTRSLHSCTCELTNQGCFLRNTQEKLKKMRDALRAAQDIVADGKFDTFTRDSQKEILHIIGFYPRHIHNAENLENTYQSKCVQLEQT